MAGAAETVRFDLDRAEGLASALEGCRDIFVMRPPPTTLRRPFQRLMQAAREAGLRHVVCASVYGAGTSRVLPHRHMEAAVRASGIAHTFLRPADFMQNLIDVHGRALREKGEIAVPAGHGRSAFIDVEDIGRACASVLAAPDVHDGRAYDLTGPEALTFAEVAAEMTRVLGRPVLYRPIPVPRFLLREVRAGRPLAITLVMAALYTVQRVGRAAPVRPDLQRLIGRPPTCLREFILHEMEAFAPATVSPTE